ncbi:MAG: tol-pal system protein YbgF [Woeseiaceae bacterium]|nr:tol-pal system protein YbgF [Woeseiaceae bacterium]
MKNLRSGKVFMLFAPVVLAGCTALTPPSEDPVLIKLAELDQRLEAIERIVQNQSLVQLSQQVTALERRADELQGAAEELEYNSTRTTERQRDLYADLDARIQALETNLTAMSQPNVLDGGTLAPGQLPVPGGSDQENYQAAFELVKEQRYEQAVMAFQEFLETFPDSDRAANAQYWLAESYYVTRRFDDALGAFQAVLDSYPGSSKDADALLKIGYCNYELKQWDEARTALTRVQADYPDTTAARFADQRLERMESEGV